VNRDVLQTHYFSIKEIGTIEFLNGGNSFLIVVHIEIPWFDAGDFRVRADLSKLCSWIINFSNGRKSCPTHNFKPEDIITMCSLLSMPPKQLTAAYAVGRELQFESLDGPILKVEVLKQLSVARHLRSQVILVKTKDSPKMIPSNLVAKCYDPTLFPVHDINEPSSPEAYCAKLKSREAKAYTRLQSLETIAVPKFYGEYQFSTGDASSNRINAILLQFIDHPNLDNLSFKNLDLDCLERVTHQSLRQCHALGVFHRDINSSNIFFTGKNAIICDWEHATFEDDYSKEDPENWRLSDESSLISTLKRFDIKDKRSLPPPKFFEWDF
jgi:serine/threonine protein kinase